MCGAYKRARSFGLLEEKGRTQNDRESRAQPSRMTQMNEATRFLTIVYIYTVKIN